MGDSSNHRALALRYNRIEGKEADRFWFTSSAPAMASVNQSIGNLRRDSMRGLPERAVLISGPIGSGQEGLARMIRASSRRGAHPWVAVNCAELDPVVLRAELFGYEKGVFQNAAESQAGLLESVQGGTIFLKEVYALDAELQADVLAFLVEGKFKRLGGTESLSADVRVIASHNLSFQPVRVKPARPVPVAVPQNVQEAAPLAVEEVSAASVVTSQSTQEAVPLVMQEVSEVPVVLPLMAFFADKQIVIPSLKDRKEDILPLAEQFAKTCFRENGKTFEGFRSDAQRALLGRSWPGNVEELFLVISRTSLLWELSGAVAVDGLSDGFGLGVHMATAASQQAPFRVVPRVDLSTESEINYTVMKKKWSDAFESEYLKETLRRNEGNVSAAAREAKLDRSNFLRLLRRHAISAESFRKGAIEDPLATPTQQIA